MRRACWRTRSLSLKTHRCRDENLSDATSTTSAWLHEQFVGENAQAVHCRGFHSQDDWAESNWLTSVTPRERKLCRSEVTLRSNEHQYVSRTITVFGRIGFKNFF